MLVWSACQRPKAKGYSGYALIATSGDESVAVVDLSVFRLLAPIPVKGRPTAVLPVGATGASFVLTPSNGSVHVISAGLQVTLSRKLADEVSEIRLTPDGKRLLAIAPRSQELIEADAVSLRVIRRNKSQCAAVDFDVSTNGYVGLSSGAHGLVELFQLDTGQHWQAKMPGPIGAVRFRADGEVLLVANLQERSLTALKVPSLEIVADLPLAMKPQNLCFNADQGQLFITGEGMDGVAIVFPYNTMEVEQTVLAGRDPGVMSCSATPAYLFVGSHSGSDVCVLDIETRAMVGMVDMGEQPTYITTTPDSQYALILDEKAGDLAVIHISAIQTKLRSVEAMRSYRVHSSLFKQGASLFAMLPVGERPVHAAVIPRQA